MQTPNIIYEKGRIQHCRCYDSLYLSCILSPLLLFLLWRQRLQLQSMYTPCPCHLLFQQSVDHPMSCRLEFGLESVRDDIDSMNFHVRSLFYGISNSLFPRNPLLKKKEKRLFDRRSVPEMSFWRRAVCHCGVVGMEMRVVVDLESCRVEGAC